MPIEPLPPEKTSPNLFARRALAYALDLALLYALTLGTSLLCLLAYAALNHPGDAAAPAALAASGRAGHFTKALHLLYYLSYFTVAHWCFGRTPGKWAAGLEVKTRGHGELGFPRALARSLLYVVSGQLTLGIGFLLPLFRKDGLTLHDLVAGTRVADAKAPRREEKLPAAA